MDNLAHPGASPPQPEPPGPRVTPADLEAEIVSEWYINAADGATACADGEFQPPVPADSPLNLLTICILVLRNGFTVTGESACASPENFDAELGREIARKKAVEKVWPLLGFRLRDAIHGVEIQMRNGVL